MQKRNLKAIHLIFKRPICTRKNKKDKMIESYLSLLDKHDYYQEAVQKALLRRLDLELEDSKEFQILKSALFERAKKENSGVIFSEMLIWLYSQVDNFEGF